MDNRFGGIIWTNHALSRLKSRGIKQGDAWATWNRPEQSRPGSGSNRGAWVYYRTWGNQKIEVVAKQNDKKEWLIVSVWSDVVPQKGHGGASKNSFWTNLKKLLWTR
jgi:hypothetical protein